MTLDMTPALSVVIPTLGRPILVKTLESLIETRGFEGIEIIIAGTIVDSAVLMRVGELCRQHPRIHHLQVSFPVGDSSEKKNAGCRLAQARIVAFIDDDVVVGGDWVQRVLEPFSEKEVGLVSGPSLVPDDLPLMARLAGVALASKASGYVSERYQVGSSRIRQVKWSRLIGCNMAYRKVVLDEIGGFDPKFYPGEEMIAAYKATQAGYKLMFCPLATLHHYPRATLRGFVRQIFSYGATRIRLYRAGVEFEWTALVPAFWVASLVLLGIGGVWCRFSVYLLGLNIALYLFAALWITVDKVKETRQGRDLMMFFIIPIMHLSYGCAEWSELFLRGKDFSDRTGRKST